MSDSEGTVGTGQWELEETAEFGDATAKPDMGNLFSLRE